jgi:ribonuclease E
MASPDEARADEARDQSDVPATPSTSTDTAAAAPREPAPATTETATAPPRRPRGAASFPGGPPPAAPAPAEVQAPPPPPPHPADPPRFRVTTVEPSAASFPGGPPPSAPPVRDDPTPTTTPEAPADPADPAAGDPAAPRTGGRRRRRGGRGRGPSTDPAAGTAETAGDDQAPAERTATDPAPAAGPAIDRAPAATAAAPARVGDAPTLPATGDQPGAPGDGQDDMATGVGGSARTRARRRRRAASKARTRDVTGEGTAQAPAQTNRPEAPGAAATSAAPPADRPAAPGAATPAAPAPAARPSRSRRRGAAGPGNGEPAAARPANGDAQPAAAEPRAANGTRTAGERTGRGRRRGRGGRLASADAAVGPADAAAEDDGTEAREEQPGGGRGHLGGPDRSTRLETRTRREGARQADRGRRRRPSGLTEEQKRVLREEGPDRRMIVTEGAERTQIGVLEGQTLVEHYVTRKAGRSMVGNIYLGRVQNVLPGMEAAFIDIGRGRNAVLYAGEVNYNEEDLDGEAPRIEKVLKAGQPVLVQVTKDPIGAKGARLTAQVSLAGRYLVLQPEDNTFGISRRLPEAERSRLRDILKEVRPKGLGMIVRTAAEGASADDLRADLARLQTRWETVAGKAKKSSAPAVIYSEPELVVRVIRDIFSPDFVQLVVDGDDLYQRVEEYLQEVAPDLLPKLHKHQGRLPVFEHYRVVEQIHKALERKVWLPSGGSIVIDRTEAMTVVDVNTGKFVGRGAGANLEETVVANNLEAADEIVRQLRLRDIGGIIIIDFIDMLFERNQQAVVDRLRAALARDKTKSQVMEVSSLGLVQMTRKRVSGGLLDSFSETCPTCDGRGVVITHEIQ